MLQSFFITKSQLNLKFQLVFQDCKYNSVVFFDGIQKILIVFRNSKILYTAAKMSKDMQAFKYARSILEKLDELILHSKFSDEIELLSMNIKAKPFKDEDELAPLCYRCSHHNPLINSKGNNCSNCGQSYVFSFASFEILPLVEFVLPNDITDEEALSLIDYVPNSQFDKDDEAKTREANAMYNGETPRASINILNYLIKFKQIKLNL
jgi:hypothetical protein